MNGTGVCDECADCETGKAAMQQLPVELSVDAIAKRNYEMRSEGRRNLCREAKGVNGGLRPKLWPLCREFVDARSPC